MDRGLREQTDWDVRRMRDLLLAALDLLCETVRDQDLPLPELTDSLDVAWIKADAIIAAAGREILGV